MAKFTPHTARLISSLDPLRAPRPSAKRKQRDGDEISLQIDNRLRWLIFLVLVALYMLVYVPVPDSADGTAILAVATALVRHSNADISIIGADDALFEFDRSRMGAWGVDGALYSKKGIAPSLALIPLVALTELFPALPLRATAMFFNPLVTAATAVLLYSLTRAFGFRPRTAFVTALLYGVATTALVYTKTLYGEPLAALLIVVGVLNLTPLSSPSPFSVREKGGKNPSEASSDGALEDMSLLKAPRHEGRLTASAEGGFGVRVESWRYLIAGAALGFAAGINLSYLVLAGIVGLAIGIKSLSKNPSSLSFSTLLNKLFPLFLYVLPILLMLALIAGYNAARFGSPFTSGYYFDSGEGFNKPFWAGAFGLTFSPYRGVFWYAPVLLLAFPGWLWLRSGAAWLLLALIIAQIATYASWWSWDGGIAWGPRFLLPVLPLMALCLAPVVERAFARAAWRVVLIALTILSIGVQILGALFSYFPYTGVLFSQHAASADDSYINQLADHVLFDPSISAIVGHAHMLMQGAPMEPAWLAGGDLTHARAVQLQAALQPPHAALIASAHYGTALLDVRRMPILSMNAPTTPDDPLASRMWAHARNRDLLWYVTWFTSADLLNWQERELWQNAAFAVQHEVDGHRALLFQLAPPLPDTTGGWTFGAIRLDAYALERRADGLLVSLAWAAEAAPDGDYTWFVHVLDANGAIIAQQDRAPQGGYAPASGWTAGQGVTDYLYFPLADAAQAAALRIGWVDPATGARLPVRDAAGGVVEDGFVVVGLDREW
ncbi:MAG: hypothetical protein SF123_21635 [Chloroflexota bacterium]|nr:hypothetical protein [Chloroflexota bacterium]